MILTRIRDFREINHQMAILRRYRLGVVVLDVARRIVVHVHGREEGVVPLVEGPAVRLKLVGEDELVVEPVGALLGVELLGRVPVDEAPEVRDVRHLPSRIGEEAECVCGV